MSQPIWKCVAQLGDVSPVDYGGYWVLIDETGVYPAEAELLVSPNDDDNGEPYTVYRIILDQCTFINGVLSDNKYHPDYAAWFATPEAARKDRPQDTTYLKNAADYCGVSDVSELVDGLTSSDPVQRANIYRMIGEYHGFENFDSYPLSLTRDEAEQRYSSPQYQID